MSLRPSGRGQTHRDRELKCLSQDLRSSSGRDRDTGTESSSVSLRTSDVPFRTGTDTQGQRAQVSLHVLPMSPSGRETDTLSQCLFLDTQSIRSTTAETHTHVHSLSVSLSGHQTIRSSTAETHTHGHSLSVSLSGHQTIRSTTAETHTHTGTRQTAGIVKYKYLI